MIMNEYRFEDLSVGMSESFCVKVTDAMLDAFLSITGDNNPLHCDEAFAKAKGYPSRVVYGLLTTSFFSKLGGCYLPGKNCLIHEVQTKCVAPVFVGDELTVTGTVKELHELFKQAVLKVEITNQDGKKVIRGTMKVGVLDEG